MIDENEIIQIFYNAISNAPPDLFDGFIDLQPILLDRSPISRNRPLYYSIIENLVHFKTTGNIIYPIPFPQLKSDETHKMCDAFFAEHLVDLQNVDISNIGSIQQFLSKIGVNGIRVLLGIRKTAGSDSSLFPPSTDKLYAAFNEKHKAQSLSVGGRALSKHSVRDSSKFWGDSCGTTDLINHNALRCLNFIVENCVWNNVFALPHDSKAYEIRCNPGYGARWEFKSDKDIFFRGFLEPVFEDGHEKRWRH